MAGIIIHEFLDFAPDDGSDTGGYNSGVFGLLSGRCITEIQIIDPDGIDRPLHLTDSRIFPPGLVGFQDNAIFINDGDVR